MQTLPSETDAASDQQRIGLALGSINEAMRRARFVRALEKAIARLEREQEEKIELIDHIEWMFLHEQSLLLDEVAAAGEQIRSFNKLVHELKGEAWVHG